MRRQRAVRVMPLALGLKLDPVQMQAAQLRGFVVRDLALDPQKAALVIVGAGCSRSQQLARGPGSGCARGSRRPRPGPARAAGFTKTESIGTLMASGWPLRSKIVPRGAGISTFNSCCWRAQARVIRVMDDLQ